VASAAQFQLGGFNGLNNSYIAASNGGSLPVGFAQKGYQNYLFLNAQNSGVLPTPGSLPFTSTGGLPPKDQLADPSNVSFNMIGNSTYGLGNLSVNDWQATGGTGSSIQVGVNRQYVTSAYTMLNNEFGGLGAIDTSVAFYFGASAGATTGLTEVLVNLTNNNGTAGNGQIRSVFNCVSGVVVPGCSTGTLAPSSTLSALINGTTTDTVTVTTNNIYSFAYTSLALGSGTGNVQLDDQGFDFSHLYQDGTLNSSQYLVNMVITELGSGSSTATTPSQTALSAITVFTAPEPTTILLFLSGLGVIGFKRFRRQ